MQPETPKCEKRHAEFLIKVECDLLHVRYNKRRNLGILLVVFFELGGLEMVVS